MYNYKLGVDLSRAEEIPPSSDLSITCLTKIIKTNIIIIKAKYITVRPTAILSHNNDAGGKNHTKIPTIIHKNNNTPYIINNIKMIPIDVRVRVRVE